MTNENNINDFLYELEWEKLPLITNSYLNNNNFIIFSNKSSDFQSIYLRFD